MCAVRQPCFVVLALVVPSLRLRTYSYIAFRLINVCMRRSEWVEFGDWSTARTVCPKYACRSHTFISKNVQRRMNFSVTGAFESLSRSLSVLLSFQFIHDGIPPSCVCLRAFDFLYRFLCVLWLPFFKFTYLLSNHRHVSFVFWFLAVDSVNLRGINALHISSPLVWLVSIGRAVPLYSVGELIQKRVA